MKCLRKQFALALITAATLILLPSCSQSKSSGPTVAVLFDGLYTPFWVAGHDAILKDLRSRGYEVLEATSDQDDTKQLSQVRAMLARGVDGIIIVHTDGNAVIPAIKAANKAGVPMVHFNRAPEPSESFSVSVQADNRVIAKATVEQMAEVASHRGGRYKAAILVGHLGDGNGIARRDGFLDAVAEHKDIIDVVARVPTEWKTDKAFDGLTNAFNANPDINFVFASSDIFLPQIVQILKANDRYFPVGDDRHVIVGGFDGDQVAYDLLQSGYLDACGVQDLEYEAKLCVDAIDNMIKGDLTESPSGKNPHVAPDPGFVIHTDNLEQVRDRMWGYHVWLDEQKQSASQ